MPMTQLHDLDLAYIGAETLRIPLPDVFLGPGVEEERASLAILDARDQEREAMGAAADVVHSEFAGGATAGGERWPIEADVLDTSCLFDCHVWRGRDRIEFIVDYHNYFHRV